MAKKTFKIKSDLANALEKTISCAQNSSGELNIQIIPIRDIIVDDQNPRELVTTLEELNSSLDPNDPEYTIKKQEQLALESLSKSIEHQGIINPILVYNDNGKYKLIAGHRRTFAAVMAKLQSMPAKILPSKPNDLSISQLQWVENIERSDLSLWERLNNIKKIINAYKKLHNISDEITPTLLADLLGCSLQQAVNYNNIITATNHNLHDLIKANKLRSIDKAATIAKSDPLIQNYLLQECLNGASLKKLKHMAKDDLTKIGNVEKEIIKSYHLGSTREITVLRIILESVLSNPNCKHLELDFDIQSNPEHDNIYQNFKHLIKSLEKNINKI